MKFLWFEIHRVKSQVKRKPRRIQKYTKWAIWRALKKEYGFNSFEDAWYWVTLNDLVDKLNEMTFLRRIEAKKPEYLV